MTWSLDIVQTRVEIHGDEPNSTSISNDRAETGMVVGINGRTLCVLDGGGARTKGRRRKKERRRGAVPECAVETCLARHQLIAPNR